MNRSRIKIVILRVDFESFTIEVLEKKLTGDTRMNMLQRLTRVHGLYCADTNLTVEDGLRAHCYRGSRIALSLYFSYKYCT